MIPRMAKPVASIAPTFVASQQQQLATDRFEAPWSLTASDGSGANGLYTESFKTPYGSIAIANHSAAATMTVVSAPPAGGPPTRGKGMATIPPGVFAVVNLASGDSLQLTFKKTFA